MRRGQDVRQDQLVLRVVALIDRLLRDAGLDLRLTPYACVATSASDGLFGVIPGSTTLRSAGDVHPYLRKHPCNWPAPGERQEFEGLNTRCVDNWTRSNAGYAVVTFILGIGDRHAENLIVTEDGRLVHIDFGFILGRDPKPFPPPLKLFRQQVQGMGGESHPRFAEFNKLCCSAYNVVRKHASLIVNMFQLMCDANIPGIADGNAQRTNTRIQGVLDKLCINLNDEEAAKHMQQIVGKAAGISQ